MKNIFKTRMRPKRSVSLGKRSARSCNLCATRFYPRTVFDRYCADCREHNELLKFSEWLPDLNSTIEEKLIA